MPKRSASMLAYFWLPCCTASKVSCLACPRAASWRCPLAWVDCCKRPASASWRRKSSLNPSACQRDLKDVRPGNSWNSWAGKIGHDREIDAAQLWLQISCKDAPLQCCFDLAALMLSQHVRCWLDASRLLCSLYLLIAFAQTVCVLYCCQPLQYITCVLMHLANGLEHPISKHKTAA